MPSSAETHELNEEFRRIAHIVVGRIGLKDALQALRAEMSSVALCRTKGSRRAAASMLQVHRRYVQRLAQELGETGASAPEAQQPDPLPGSAAAEALG